MRKKKISKYILTIILGTCYVFIILFSWGSYPALKLWKRIDITLIDFYFNFTFFRMIHFIIGISFFIYGVLNVIEIININKKAQLERNKPKYIIKDGLYGKIRHPMYTMIMIIQASLFFSLCSALGILFSSFFILFFMILGLYEEKYQLIPIFGRRYREYIDQVEIRFFPRYVKIYLIIMYSLLFLGLIF